MSRGPYKFLVLTTCISYVMFATLGFIAFNGGSPAFPMDFNQVSQKYMTEMTPTSRVSVLWTINVAYQFVWLLYSLVTLFREGSATKVQSSYTISAFLVYTMLGVAWLFVWSRGHLYWSLAIIVMGQYALCIAYGCACADLLYFLRYNEVTLQNIRDVWCQRMLVQNGMMFTVAFNAVWSFLTLTMFLTYELETDSATTSLLALALLGLTVIVWFFLENTMLKDHVQFTCSHYAVLIGALISIHQRRRQSGDDPYGVSALVIGLMVITCLLCCIRLVVLFFKSYEKRKPSKGEKLKLANRQIRPDDTASTSVKVYRTFTSF